MGWDHLLYQEKARLQAITSGMVMPDQKRCVQCGICSFHCPINIDIRRHAWEGVPIKDSHCLTCGECICRCPRGALSLVKAAVFSEKGGK